MIVCKEERMIKFLDCHPIYSNFTSVGKIWLTSIPVSQSWLDIGALFAVIQIFHVDFVFEIGVHHGGLAALFIQRAEIDENFRYLGVENEFNIVSPVIPDEYYRIADAWADDTISWAAEEMRETNGPALILCDGGDKRRDLRTYAPILRPNDLIGVHDFGKEILLSDVQIDGFEIYRPLWMELTRWCILRKV